MLSHSLAEPKNKISKIQRVWWNISDKIDDMLTDRGIYLHRKVSDAIYYVKCRIKQTHMIDTKLDRGHWIDKVSLMEAGLLELVDNFVSRDGEDAFSVVYWDEGGHLEIKEKIIQILHWKYIGKPELESKIDSLWSQYHKDYPVYFEKIEGSNCSEMKRKNEDEESDKKYQTIRELENELVIKSQENLHLCVDIREFLWT
jgi:hypothetical protein